MNILVAIKLVPDLVEELEIDPGGTQLDPTWLRTKLNEFDDHAIEQALILKERFQAHVAVIAPAMDGTEDALYTAAARGVDRLIRLSVDFEAGLNNHALARLLAEIWKAHPTDLILTGVQAHNDLDGSLGPLLAGYLDLPYLGYVSGVSLESANGSALVRKEYPGGLIVEMQVSLPAILGIQAAERPPAYIAFSKIRQAMKTATIEDLPGGEVQLDGGLAVERMFKPESGARATMIAGDVDHVADELVKIFESIGIL